MQRRISPLWVLGMLMAVAAAYSSSNKLLSSWKDPSVKKLSFQRVVAVALTEDGPTRRAAEREMAAIIGPKAVPSSQVIPDADIRDADKVRAFSSGAVDYEGSGAYFLDKVRDGVWRLEVYPDEILVRDPFEQPRPDKIVSRLL